MKKIIKPLSIALILATMLIGLTLIGSGCGAASPVGNAPTQAELTGRWNLTQTRYTGGMGGCGMAVTNRPGDFLWSGGYFIQFNENGTFSESNFWSFSNSGTWTLIGDSLTLNGGGGAPAFGELQFISDRRVGLQGNTLTMTYTRRSGINTWHYLHTFTRA